MTPFALGVGIEYYQFFMCLGVLLGSCCGSAVAYVRIEERRYSSDGNTSVGDIFMASLVGSIAGGFMGLGYAMLWPIANIPIAVACVFMIPLYIEIKQRQ